MSKPALPPVPALLTIQEGLKACWKLLLPPTALITGCSSNWVTFAR
jgi:hypothetical protein